jgi:hypothetical protein
MRDKANDSALIKSFFKQNPDLWSLEQFEENDDKRH